MTLRTAAAQQEQVPLDLKLGHAREVVPFEPLLVAVKLCASTERNVRVIGEFRPSLRLEYRRAQDEIWLPAGPSPTAIAEQPLTLLAPGFTVFGPVGQTWDVWVYWISPQENNGRSFVFHEPGEYELRASVEVRVRVENAPSRHMVRSSPSRLRVNQPNEQDTVAGRVMSHPRMVNSICAWDFSNDETIAYLREVADKYRRSTMTDYCNYMIGYWHLRQFSDLYKSEDGDHLVDAMQQELASALRRFSLISTRNPLMRQRGAMQLLNVRVSHEKRAGSIPAENLAVMLNDAEMLPTRMFQFSSEQERIQQLQAFLITDDKDQRLDDLIEIEFPEDEPWVRLVERVSAATGVKLDYADAPPEVLTEAVTRTYSSPVPLRRFLIESHPRAWYWMGSTGGTYVLRYRPKF